MVDIASFRFNDPGKAFDAGYGRVNALRTDRARMTAGNALSGGDYGGAANALYGAGELEAGARVQGMGESRQAITAKVAKDREAETIAAWGEAAGRLQTIRERDQNPNAVVAGFDQFFAPRLQQLGETPENIAKARNLLTTDPDNTLLALGAGAAKQLGYDTSVVGEELIVTDKASGKVVGRYRGKRTLSVPDGTNVYETGGDGGGAPPPAGQPNAAPAPPAPAGGGEDEMKATLSSVLPGARFTSGRRTPEHNRAVGGAENSYHLKGQALDIVPPAGMTTAQAAEAIRASGQYAEVIDEGDHVHVAWGGGGSAPAPLAGGSGQDRVADGGPKLLVSRPKAAKEREAPSGYQYGPDGALSPIAGGPAEQSQRGQIFTQENQLRGQFGQQGAVKDLAAVRAHVATIGSIAQKARGGQPVTAADDLALIFAFMKMLDPGSVVREGEFANAQNTAGVPEQISNMYNRALKGTRLSAAQRDEFFQTATNVMDNYTNAYADQADQSRARAQSYGLNADRVTPAPTRPAARTAPRGEIRTVRTPAEARALPPGTRFRGPDGQVRTRP